MSTKISRYADGILETAWLAAVIVVPVFFNVYSSRIFEPDKITLLRTLALVILAAWLVKLLEEGGFRWEQIHPQGSRLKTLLRIPLVAPVLVLALVYILATVFSVTPWVSLWGSYQRLQGTYTTFAYLVVFAAMAANLRRREQVERLLGAAILASLPVSLYGILQRYRADPIPWGGDVVGRIASNMGNSIFVAAFLIMVFPITAMRVVESFEALMTDRGRLWPNLVRSTGYVFIIALQTVALYFSGSRGPWLGWGASLVLLWLGLSLAWRARWMTITGVVLAIAAAVFLVTLNIPNGPLQSLRAQPEFGRLGELLDASSRTGQVRTLIWKGASELVQPHEPLEFPDGRQDPFNFLRPLIGYGPESMYVAYNRFYPPELTLVEKRNASPDRSHNETWDSLVITGALGLLVYLALFGSVFYYGLKWLGMLRGPRQRNLFLALYILGGAAGAVGFVAWKGIAYLGVALPFGMILGVILYLILVSLFGHVEGSGTTEGRLRRYVLLGLLGAIVAHFIEINFGIAIVATRTYFWMYTALLLLVGYVLPLHKEYRLSVDEQEAGPLTEAGTQAEAAPQASAAAAAIAPNKASRATSGKRTSPAAPNGKQSARQRAPVQPRRKPARGSFLERISSGWVQQALVTAFILAVLLTSLGYEYISNISRKPGALDLLWSSLTSLGNAQGRTSYGVLALLLTTWLIGAALLISEYYAGGVAAQSGTEGAASPEEPGWATTWLKTIGVALGLSLAAALIFWLWHASNLAALGRAVPNSTADVLEQVRRSEQLLTTYYIFLFLLVFSAATAIPASWPAQGGRWPVISQIVAPGALALALLLGSVTNMRVIQADMSFKTADLFARPGTWPVAIEIYNRANQMAPNEDYYYLFLGRAYLEYAKTLQDPNEREALIGQAARDLKKAQEINPLNTDHTANLARLHSLWASYATDPDRRQELGRLSEDYFSKAVLLSPNSARLWDEWAVLYMNILQLPEPAQERLMRALEIDPYYDWTYALLGDYYTRYVAAPGNNLPAEELNQALIQASEYYSKAASLIDPTNTALRANYWIAMGGVFSQLNDQEKTIAAYEQALQTYPENADAWRLRMALAQLFAQRGEVQRALEYARGALEQAPEDQKPAIQSLIQQLGG